jgi:hypothetical protein
MTAQNIYIVQLLGGGDNENEYDNICAFATYTSAEAHIAQMQLEDGDIELDYNIAELILNN